MTYRLLLHGEELIPGLVESAKVGHVGQVDVDLEDVVQAAAAGLQDGLEVEQGAAGAVLDGAGDDLLGLGVHADGAAAEDDAVVDGGLGELGERRGRRGGADGGLGHCGGRGSSGCQDVW